MKILVALLLLGVSLQAEEPLSRIAFGSCANEHRPQPIWKAINETKPQLFIFMGDNVYVDSADPAKLKESYDLLAEIPGVAELRENTPILATWDDHDYGKNDVGAEWEGKEASKEAFMEFFETPTDSPLRKRGGVYDAKIFGPEGKRVQVILLDTR
ncbi:MAG: alkaline phosphatase D family protein, partial [Chthoniobacterales bacterium]